MGAVDEAYLRRKQQENLESDPEWNATRRWDRVEVVTNRLGQRQVFGVDETAGLSRLIRIEGEPIEGPAGDAALQGEPQGAPALAPPADAPIVPSVDDAVITDVGRGVVAGANTAVEEIVQTLNLDGAAKWLEENVPLGSVKYELPRTVAGEAASAVAQGATAMVPAAKALKGLGVANSFLRWTLAGAGADFAAFDPDDPALGELAQAIGPLDNETAEAVRSTVADALARDIDDTELEKRLKGVGGGVLSGVVVDGTMAGFRALKGIANNPQAMVDLVKRFPEMRGIVDDMRRLLTDESGELKIGRAAPQALSGDVRKLTNGYLVRRLNEPGAVEGGVNYELMSPNGTPLLYGKSVKDVLRRGFPKEDRPALVPLDNPRRGNKNLPDDAVRWVSSFIKDVGPPGFSIEGAGSARVAVYRGRDGKAIGTLTFTVDESGKVIPDEGLAVFVEPEYRRQGIASRLYDYAQAKGFDVDSASGVDNTAAGAAFVNARGAFSALAPFAADGAIDRDDDGEIQVAGIGDKLLRALMRGAAEGADVPATRAAAEIAEEGAARLPQGAADVIADPWRSFKDGDPVQGVDFNFANLDTNDAVKRQINNVSEAYAKETDKIKKGAVPLEVTRQLGDLLAADPDKVDEIVKGFEAGGVEDLHVKALVMRKALVQSAEELDAMARKVAAPDETVSNADYLAFREHLARHAHLQMQMKGMQTEIGRALSSFRIAADAPSLARGEAARELLDRLGGDGTTRELAQKYLATPVEKRARFVERSFGTRIKDAIFEVWINGLLSGPRTHQVNIASNILFAGMQMPERLAASVFGKALPRGAESDRVLMGESLVMVNGFVRGVGDGLRLGWQAFKTESPSGALDKAETVGMRSIAPEKFNVDPASWGGRMIDYLGQGVRLPGRALMAEDEFFKAVNYRMELHALAYRRSMEAAARGATKDQAAAIYTKVMNEGDASAVDAARDFANVNTFTKELGKAGQKFQSLASSVPGMRVVVPFIRTPVNVMKEFGKRSPMALAMPKSFWAEVGAGGARRDLALAKLSTGSALMAWAASLATDGVITGGGPTDPGLRAAWRETHEPYSVKIGDTWYPYGRLEPLGMIFGVAADYADFTRYKDPSAEDEQIAAQAVGSIMQNLGDKTFLTGLSAFAAAYNDPDRYAQRFVQQLAGSVIPTVVSDVEGAFDPAYSETGVDPNMPFAQRQFYSLLNAAKSRTPGWSADLPPARTFWGEEIRAYEGHWSQAFYAFRTKSVKESPIDEELLRLLYPLSKPRKEVDGVKLSPQQYDRLIVLMNETKGESTDNKTMREYYNDYVQSPDYMLLPDVDKIEHLRAIRRAFYEAAKEQLMAEDPDLMARVMVSKALREVGVER